MRPRYRWMIAVLSKLGWQDVDWILLAEDRDQ
jgi:hypothetical protein